MNARQVRQLDHTREDRLVAIMAAVGSALPLAQIHDRVAEVFPTVADLQRSIAQLLLDGRVNVQFRDGVRIYSATTTTTATTPTPEPQPTNEDTMSRNDSAGLSREKFVALFAREKRWISPKEIAAEIGMSSVSCKYHLTALEEQGVIKSRGRTATRRYAHVSVADEIVATRGADPQAEVTPAPPKKPRKPALRRKTARARRLRGDAPAPLPVPMPQSPVPMPTHEGMVVAINDSGEIGITKGTERIALEAGDVRNLLRFLDNTKPLWHQRKRAA